MATIVLSAVGAAVGGSLGGSVLGLSSAVIGRAVGATIGRVIDQKLLGGGSAAVETGRVDRFRLTGAGEGTPLRQSFGRSRVPGHVIWSSRFLERTKVTDLGKNQPDVTEFSYSVSLALALCRGRIASVNRIWADGKEVRVNSLNLSVYTGGPDQQPDPRMELIEGAGNVPAYRGLAYVVIEDLALGRFGNRVPQFTFEIQRPLPGGEGTSAALTDGLRGVAMIPGTGEYALATSPVHYAGALGANKSANVHSASGKTDFATSLDHLSAEVPNCGSVLLVASWFGDDLRCGSCTIRPKVEQKQADGSLPWRVSSETRATAAMVPQVDGAVVYGGTPDDRSVIEAIHALKASGKAVVFYPFILMDQLAGNTLPDPWSGTEGQPELPWRGRITASLAAGVPGSPDGTQAAADEVSAFFGTAQAGHFTPGANTVAYSGPSEWSYRRFVLHYAHLCALAGGVDAFCIGSEMRGLTQVRGPGGSYPAVQALIALAADVRGILGPGVKLTYAADWSEYFGHHPQDGSGDVVFHLDPLWASDDIDAVGIDNYMPLSDWRDGYDHADAQAGWDSLYALDYLRANVEGGEGYDWYYASNAARDAQRRTPIVDGAHGEDWVFRYKDLRNWWQNPHHNRIGGVRSVEPTAWVPEGKPLWFTEYGCAAIDKGTNQPNRFYDPKSSESGVPYFSTGARDDFVQHQYYLALNSYWSDPARNPVSQVYGGPMVDMDRAHAWAWDARPYPQFPARGDVWADGGNYARGHWLNGRVGSVSLARLVTHICSVAGITRVDTSQLYGLVRGYDLTDIDTARAALQPLMLAYGFDVTERGGVLQFRTRTGRLNLTVPEGMTAVLDGDPGDVELSRSPFAETVGRVRLNYVQADGDFAARAAEAIFPDDTSDAVAVSDIPLVLTKAEAQAIVQRWLAEARVARDRVRFALPPSQQSIGAGDVVALNPAEGAPQYRLDRVEQGEALIVEGTRVDDTVYAAPVPEEEVTHVPATEAAVPVFAQFMDLPLLTGAEVEHAPHVAVAANPWPGSVAVYAAAQDNGYTLNRTLLRAATIGTTQTPLYRATPGIWDKGAALRVALSGGSLSSATVQAVLSGANAVAIGDGSVGNWEVFQFTDATLVAPLTYDLTGRLRGQAGTDAMMPDVWPVGSLLVALDGDPQQIDLLSNQRGLARYYRVGPGSRPVDDPSFQLFVEAFAGVGLRPYAPVHLRVVPDGGGFAFSWVRRTRIDGDLWDGLDVPLGEALEAYQLRVLDGQGGLVREVTVAQPAWVYDAAAMATDGVMASFSVEVAQISDRFGPGLFRRIDVNV